jgi:hypothetical protein
MKKFIYILAIAFVSSLAITSCTEVEVAPAAGAGPGGGDLDPVK